MEIYRGVDTWPGARWPVQEQGVCSFPPFRLSTLTAVIIDLSQRGTISGEANLSVKQIPF